MPDQTTTIVPVRSMSSACPRAQAELAVCEARRLFRRTLATWALDLLELRRRGLTEAHWRNERGHGAHWSRAA